MKKEIIDIPEVSLSDVKEFWVLGSQYKDGILGEYNLKIDVKAAITGSGEDDEDKTDYTEVPFTVEALGSGDISWALGDKTVQYSKNEGSWETMTNDTTIPVVQGDEIQFKGTNTTYSGNNISSTAQFNAKGNIMSLIGGDGFATVSEISEGSAFCRFFKNNTNLVSAGNLILSATTITGSCYKEMFYGCTSLTEAPKFVATSNRAGSSHESMFQNCTSLTVAPELPSLAVGGYGYIRMFEGCTALTTAPELPATDIQNYGYLYMFKGCTSLEAASQLPATTLTADCYGYMFSGCTALVTAPELPATTLATQCYERMFENCTSLTRAPELPAETLVSGCYRYMFSGCGSLEYIKALFTTTPSSSYTNMWVNGVAASGTFVKNSAATWTTTGNNGIPSGWTATTQEI